MRKAATYEVEDDGRFGYNVLEVGQGSGESVDTDSLNLLCSLFGAYICVYVKLRSIRMLQERVQKGSPDVSWVDGMRNGAGKARTQSTSTHHTGRAQRY